MSAVTWTYHLIAVHGAAGEDAAIVGADVLDRIVMAVDIEHRDLYAVDLDRAELAGAQLVLRRHVNPVSHCCAPVRQTLSFPQLTAFPIPGAPPRTSFHASTA